MSTDIQHSLFPPIEFHMLKEPYSNKLEITKIIQLIHLMKQIIQWELIVLSHIKCSEYKGVQKTVPKHVCLQIKENDLLLTLYDQVSSTWIISNI